LSYPRSAVSRPADNVHLGHKTMRVVAADGADSPPVLAVEEIL
jgi:hypothetical protein